MNLSHDDTIACIARTNAKPVENKRAQREKVSEDIERFLANGGQIDTNCKCPTLYASTSARRSVWIVAPPEVENMKRKIL